MKKLLTIALLLVFAVAGVKVDASNIRIKSSPTIEAYGVNFRVSFPLEWDYSWRIPNYEHWDAAWVFMKIKISEGAWDHLYLDPREGVEFHGANVPMTYHFGKSDVQLNTGYAERACGVFLYQKKFGQGNIAIEKVSMIWNPNEIQPEYFDGINWKTTKDLYEGDLSIRVFAIEMCYVPEGAFLVGTDGDETGRFSRGDDQTQAFVVENEQEFLLGTPGNFTGTDRTLTCVNGGTLASGQTVPNRFPKGYSAFYVMKYEMTQEAYSDFLNTLTYNQQIDRLYTPSMTPASAENTIAMLIDPNLPSSCVVIQTPGVAPIDGTELGSPAKFACNYNKNTRYNELNDGQNKAMPVRFDDMLVYMDFCALRFLTELEYEKACRGPLDPVKNEFAWGEDAFAMASNFKNDGEPNEAPQEDLTNIFYNATYTHTSANRVDQFANLFRNGGFATDTSTRFQAGATFWGVMEMSGNLCEVVVGLHAVDGLKYQGRHGDGRITIDGKVSPPFGSFWPAMSGASALANAPAAFGARGGAFVHAISNMPSGMYHRVSDRGMMTTLGAPHTAYGLRGCRTENPRLQSSADIMY